MTADFPNASDFAEKLQLKQEADRKSKETAHQLKVSNQLALIMKKLERFDIDCDLCGNLSIPANEFDPDGIYEENLRIIDQKGWSVRYNERFFQYITYPHREYIFNIKS